MNDIQFKSQLDTYTNVVEAGLKRYIGELDCNKYSVAQAMEYSLLVGGKRIRPVLVLAFCKACSGNFEQALPFACAVEMVHSYSLIHDDLPCMDDDDIRRGKPSCHKAFGEADALLAGDGLLNLAFETASGRFGDIQVDSDTQVKAISYLAQCSGISGMIAGQNLDLKNENKKLTKSELLEINTLKTGALLRAACAIGAIVGGGDKSALRAAEKYGENLGLVFQVVDDILDVIGDEASLGKPVGSDSENDKSTFPAVFGLEESVKYAESVTAVAKDAVSGFKDNEFLLLLADSLKQRKK